MDAEFLIDLVSDFTEFSMTSNNSLILDLVNYGIKYKNIKESYLLKLNNKEQLLLRAILNLTGTKIIIDS